MIPIGAYIGETLIAKAALVTSVLFVLVVELLNSGIEAVVDRVGDEPHKLSGRAKDMGSAAVMISLVMTALIWAAVILEQYQLLS
jgi:diacylglycerol kinase (ATP)